MKVLLRINVLGVLGSIILASIFLGAAAVPVAMAAPDQSPRDFIKDVVYNELQDRARLSLWEYQVQRRIGQHTLLEQQVETVDGPVHRVLANADSPLTDVQRREEQAREAELLRDPRLQGRIKQQQEDDEQRLERLMKLMPEAFLFDYDGTENGMTRLKFRPDPAYNPPSYESRVFHGLAGTVWIDPGQKRMVHLNGTIVERIDFGFGLLGHIEKGGTFELKRQQVSAAHWKTSLVDVHIDGKVIFFKTLNKDQREIRSDFKAVPGGTTMKQGTEILSRLPGPV